MAINLNDNLKVLTGQPVDAKWGPYASIQDANTKIPSSERYIGLTVAIKSQDNSTIDEYWYINGIQNTDLVKKDLSYLKASLTDPGEDPVLDNGVVDQAKQLYDTANGKTALRISDGNIDFGPYGTETIYNFPKTIGGLEYLNIAVVGIGNGFSADGIFYPYSCIWTRREKVNGKYFYQPEYWYNGAPELSIQWHVDGPDIKEWRIYDNNGDVLFRSTADCAYPWQVPSSGIFSWQAIEATTPASEIKIKPLQPAFLNEVLYASGPASAQSVKAATELHSTELDNSVALKFDGAGDGWFIYDKENFRESLEVPKAGLDAGGDVQRAAQLYNSAHGNIGLQITDETVIFNGVEYEDTSGGSLAGSFRLALDAASTSHKSTHAAGGSDALTPSDIGALDKVQGLQISGFKNWNFNSVPQSFNGYYSLVGHQNGAPIFRKGDGFEFYKTSGDNGEWIIETPQGAVIGSSNSGDPSDIPWDDWYIDDDGGGVITEPLFTVVGGNPQAYSIQKISPVDNKLDKINAVIVSGLTDGALHINGVYSVTGLSKGGRAFYTKQDGLGGRLYYDDYNGEAPARWILDAAIQIPGVGISNSPSIEATGTWTYPWEIPNSSWVLSAYHPTQHNPPDIILDISGIFIQPIFAIPNDAYGVIKSPNLLDNTKFLMGNGTWSDVPRPDSALPNSFKILQAGTGSLNFALTSGEFIYAGNYTYINSNNSSYVVKVIDVPLDPPQETSWRWAIVSIIGQTEQSLYVTSEFVQNPALPGSNIPNPTTLNWIIGNGGNNPLPIFQDGHTHQVFRGANAQFTLGRSGFVPAPGANDSTKFLKGDGTWATPSDQDTTVESYAAAGSLGFTIPRLDSRNRVVFIETTTNDTNNFVLGFSGNDLSYTSTKNGDKITVIYANALNKNKKIKLLVQDLVDTYLPYDNTTTINIFESFTVVYDSGAWKLISVNKNKLTAADGINTSPGLITQSDKLKLDSVFPTTLRNETIQMYRWAELSNTGWTAGTTGSLEENGGLNISLQERNWLAGTDGTVFATDLLLGRNGWVKLDEYFDWDPFQWYGANNFQVNLFVRTGTVSGDGLHLLIRRRKLPIDPTIPTGMMQFSSTVNMVDFPINTTNSTYTALFGGLNANLIGGTTACPQRISIASFSAINDTTTVLNTTQVLNGRTIGTTVKFNAGDLITIAGSATGVSGQTYTVQSVNASGNQLTVTHQSGLIQSNPNWLTQVIDSRVGVYFHQIFYNYPTMDLSPMQWNGPARERWEFWAACYAPSGAVPNSAWIGEITLKLKPQ